MITIASLLEDSAFDAEAFAMRLLYFFRQKAYHRNYSTPLDLFLVRKGRLFGRKVLRSYIAFLVDNLKTAGSRPLTILLNGNKKSKFSKRQLDKILGYVFNAMNIMSSSRQYTRVHHSMIGSGLKQQSRASSTRILILIFIIGLSYTNLFHLKSILSISSWTN
jgi:hypothetical protein